MLQSKSKSATNLGVPMNKVAFNDENLPAGKATAVLQKKSSSNSMNTSVPLRTALGELTNVMDATKVNQAKKNESKSSSVVSLIEPITKRLLKKTSKGSMSTAASNPQLVLPMDSEVSIESMEIDMREAELLYPDPVDNIDENDEFDPIFCTEYVPMISSYLKTKEKAGQVSSRYLEVQKEIQSHHRLILVDWMAEVSTKFKLLSETLFLAVSITNRFLEGRQVSLNKLQLVGIAATLIAAKYEEIILPEVQDFLYICDEAFTRDQLLDMETLILSSLDFAVDYPSPLHFLRRYSKAAKSDRNVHTLAKYLCELSILDEKVLQYRPSLIAAASVYLAKRMTRLGPEWTATLHHYTGYGVKDIWECSQLLNEIHKGQATSKHRNIYDKYSSPKLLQVAMIPALLSL